MSQLTNSETLGTCPQCGGIVGLTVTISDSQITYSGSCSTHGSFERKVQRLDMSEAGKKIESRVAYKGQEASVPQSKSA